MSAVLVIGTALNDAAVFREANGLDGAKLISPRSFNRICGMRIERFYVTREALRHPGLFNYVLTAQRIMCRQTSQGATDGSRSGGGALQGSAAVASTRGPVSRRSVD